MEKEENHKLAFLHVLVDNSHPDSLATSLFPKKTYTGLLTNFFSFTPFSYKIGLIHTLVDRAFKINNTWGGFHSDIQQLTSILMKNCFPCKIIHRVVSTFIRFTTPQLMHPGRTILRERPNGFSNYHILASFSL